MAMIYSEDFRKRFLSRVRITSESECWLWSAGKDHYGYGAIAHDWKMLKAHRVAWELENGRIPDGLCVLHRCDVPACINPAHLFLGTMADNSADMVSKHRHQPIRLIGSDNPAARVTSDSVLEIRQMHDSGIPARAISEKFGISKSQVRNIGNRRQWSHVS